jgi:hypothetical protein
VGRRYRFVVYEPGSAGYYEALIRNNRHLREIVGRHGIDLLEPKKVSELILFVAKYRMFVCDNRITWDGEPNEPGAPAFRIEFQVERLFGDDKVTPVNVGGENDAAINKNKMFMSLGELLFAILFILIKLIYSRLYVHVC